MTLGVYAQNWLTGVTPTVRPNTASFYRTLAEVELSPLHDRQLGQITPPLIREWMGDLLNGHGYSPRTVKGSLDVLRMILKQAVIDGLLSRNVAELVKPPKLEQAEPRHFTAEQARRFLEVCDGDPLGSLYAVALGTGLRRGETLALTWGDVDFGSEQRSATISVRRSKTDAGRRVVPVPGFAVDWLRRLDKRPGPIWPYRPEYVTRHFQELCRRAGVPVLTLHELRHTASTLMMEAGVPLEVRRRLLGHSRTEMTVHYSHADDETRRKAAEQLDRLVG